MQIQSKCTYCSWSRNRYQQIYVQEEVLWDQILHSLSNAADDITQRLKYDDVFKRFFINYRKKLAQEDDGLICPANLSRLWQASEGADAVQDTGKKDQQQFAWSLDESMVGFSVRQSRMQFQQQAKPIPDGELDDEESAKEQEEQQEDDILMWQEQKRCGSIRVTYSIYGVANQFRMPEGSWKETSTTLLLRWKNKMGNHFLEKWLHLLGN